jgi:hypothetical protein
MHVMRDTGNETSTSKHVYLYNAYAEVKSGSHGPSNVVKELWRYGKLFFYFDCPCLKVNMSYPMQGSHAEPCMPNSFKLGPCLLCSKVLDMAMLTSRFLLCPYSYLSPTCAVMATCSVGLDYSWAFHIYSIDLYV